MKTKHWLCTKLIAHRGLFNNVDIPENSLKAFEEAVKNNFAIELDVQPTKDGVAVVFHDDTLFRMTGIEGLLKEKNFDEIKDLKLLNTECKIPTFEEFLKLIDGRTQLVVEIKSHKNIGVFEQTVFKILNAYKGEYVVESFNPFIVRWFKVNAPDVVRGQLSGDFEDSKLPRFQKFLLRNLKFCRWNGSQFVAYSIDSMENFPKLAKVVAKWRKKLPVIVYTVKSQKQYDRTSRLYDNMIFDSFVPKI